MVAQLDTKTVYTFMDSLISIKKYVETAKNLGYQTLGIMDIDNLYGVHGNGDRARNSAAFRRGNDLGLRWTSS